MKTRWSEPNRTEASTRAIGVNAASRKVHYELGSGPGTRILQLDEICAEKDKFITQYMLDRAARLANVV